MSVFFFTASASASASAIASGYTTRPLVYKSTHAFATAYVSYGDTGYRQEHVRSIWGRPSCGGQQGMESERTGNNVHYAQSVA